MSQMNDGDPFPRTIRALSAAFREGSVSPVTATKEHLARIETLGRRLNAFITILGETALKTAAESERRYRAGTPLSPLDGVPIAVKDVFCIRGERCTAGSKILANNIAAYDAPVVKYLKDGGAVLVGTANMHEFAAGVTSVNPHYGPVRNPWDESRVAGGSSGGSAVAVATRMAEGAIGTDTAGSVRIPAALCGVIGFKPTYGRLSRLGVIPLASSLDTVGILAQTAWDTAAMLQTMVRRDGSDMTTVDEPIPDYTSTLSRPFAGSRVGIVRQYFHDILDPRVEENFASFASSLRGIGCSVEEADLEGIEVQDVYDRWVLIRRAEATAFHQRWLQSSPELYGDDVRKLLELGKGVLAVDYINALNARPAIIERFSETMKRFDFLLAPTTCTPAPKIEQIDLSIGGKGITTYSALNRLTLPFNYIGFPAISIPSGRVDGLPLGVQIVGKLFDEAGLLQIAHAYEEKFGPYPFPPFHRSPPATG